MSNQGSHMQEHMPQNGEIIGMLQFLVENVTQIQSDVTELKSDVSTLKSDVSGLKNDVSTLKSDVSELREELSNTEIRIGNQMSDLKEDLTLEMHRLFGSSIACIDDESTRRRTLERRVVRLEEKVFA